MGIKETISIPKAFIWRRLHSLLGLMIVVYLIEHLIVNSQAALWIGDDGKGFIKLVNLIHSLPYLQLVEISLIGVPILFHGFLGIKYALTSKANAFNKKDKPSLSYGRNVAFSWQRITSWILLVGILVHVIQMRFLESPKKTVFDNSFQYTVKLDFDKGLYSLSNRLNVKLFDREKINVLYDSFNKKNQMDRWTLSKSIPYDPMEEKKIIQTQNYAQTKEFINTLKSYYLSDRQVVASSSNIGTAFLLMVRDVFKSYFWSIFYSIFVIAAVFHAFNGLWTALITWGVILSYRSQKMMVNFSIFLMGLVGFLGLVAIWGSYIINLRS